MHLYISSVASRNPVALRRAARELPYVFVEALNGTKLTASPYGNHFRFAWGVFKPKTRILDEVSRSRPRT